MIYLQYYYHSSYDKLITNSKIDSLKIIKIDNCLNNQKYQKIYWKNFKQLKFH